MFFLALRGICWQLNIVEQISDFKMAHFKNLADFLDAVSRILVYNTILYVAVCHAGLILPYITKDIILFFKTTPKYKIY